MKILLIAGHGAGDPGAVGNGCKEADLTREVVSLLKTRLSKFAEVAVHDTTKNAFAILNNGGYINFKPYDYVLEVHFNAFNGAAYGTEIFVTSSEKNTAVEQKIVKNISALGFTNRGVKVNDWYLIRTAKKQGVSAALLEVCFIDNTSDMAKYKTKKGQIADAITSGIVEGFNLKAGQASPTFRDTVQKRFGFDDSTMTYLDGHPFPDALYQKLATKK